MINGLVYDYESIKLMLPAGLTPGCGSIDYSDEKGDEAVTGTNGLPPGIGRGGYKGTRKLELQRFEYDKLCLYSAASGGFCNMPPVPVIASYGNAGQAPVTDSMLVHFTKRGFKGSKNDTSLAVSVEVEIYEGGVSFNDYNIEERAHFLRLAAKNRALRGFRRLRGRSAPLQSLAHEPPAPPAGGEFNYGGIDIREGLYIY
jgi:hypothetical protein